MFKWNFLQRNYCILPLTQNSDIQLLTGITGSTTCLVLQIQILYNVNDSISLPIHHNSAIKALHFLFISVSFNHNTSGFQGFMFPSFEFSTTNSGHLRYGNCPIEIFRVCFSFDTESGGIKFLSVRNHG